MNEKFYNLSEERQERIINAAMDVFSKSSYKHAATDDIIKRAEISKGLLFHYFENKKNLYTYIYDFAVHYINLELKANIPKETVGYFDIVTGIERTFLDISRIYPYMRYFLIRCGNETQEDILAATLYCRKLWADTLAEFLEKADYTIFGDVKEDLLAVIGYTTDGILAKYSKYGQDTFDDILYYIDFFKRVLAG